MTPELENMIVPNFFDNIALSNLEKVHSQIIAWIFSADCKAILPFGKKVLIKEIFDKLDENIQIENFLDENIQIENFLDENFIVQTETDNIDILIRTSQVSILIENKIKTSEHSNQLNKYAEKYEGWKLIYLTLSEEKPISDSANKWHNVTYKSILESVSRLSDCYFNKNTNDFVILIEYLKSINNLIIMMRTYILNASRFPFVFSKSYSDINSSMEEDKISAYIVKFKFGTFLQKLFFREVAKLITNEAKNKKYKFWIRETHGNAEIGIDLEPFRNFTLCFSFQSNAFKLWINSDNNELKEKILLEIKSKYSYNHINYRRKHNGGNMCSITQAITPQIHTFDLIQFSKFFNEKFEEAINIYEHLKEFNFE